MLVLDTNAIIDYLADDANLVALLDGRGQRGEELAIPTIVIVELLCYPDLKDEERDKTRSFIFEATMLDLTFEIALRAAALRSDHSLKAIDAVIAATALVWASPLVSRDREFRRVPSLELLG